MNANPSVKFEAHNLGVERRNNSRGGLLNPFCNLEVSAKWIGARDPYRGDFYHVTVWNRLQSFKGAGQFAAYCIKIEARDRRQQFKILPGLIKFLSLCHLNLWRTYCSARKKPCIKSQQNYHVVCFIPKLFGRVSDSQIESELLSLRVAPLFRSVIIYFRHCSMIRECCCTQRNKRSNQRLPFPQDKSLRIDGEAGQHNGRRNEQGKGEKVKPFNHKPKLPRAVPIVERVAA